MPLPPYQSCSTPPEADVPELMLGRRASNASYVSMDSFSDSIDMRARTPRHSPGRPGAAAAAAAKMLPRLRTQEHALEPPSKRQYLQPSADDTPSTAYPGTAASSAFPESATSGYAALSFPSSATSAFATSAFPNSAFLSPWAAEFTSTNFPDHSANPFAPVPPAARRHAVHRRAVSTGFEALRQRPTSSGHGTLTPEPESAVSDSQHMFEEQFQAYSPTAGLGPAHMTSSHGRSVSTSNISEADVRKFCNPNTRPPPVPQPCWSAPLPQAMPAADVTPISAVPVCAEATESWGLCLSEDMQYSRPDEETLTLDAYLRAPNPSLVYPNACNPTPQTWWDVRNILEWKDFSLNAVLQVPGFARLLTTPMPSKAFPNPILKHHHVYPRSDADLADACDVFYATKLNAALKRVVPWDAPQLVMRQTRERHGPAFGSYMEDAVNGTIHSTSHVVGVVRSHHAWNSALRVGNEIAQIQYLDALAQLHRHMREKGTRYGFILTETELVCARLITDAVGVPLFGALELAAPISTRHSAPGLSSPPLSDEDAQREGLTALLGLWYLHMLAKDTPLPGQPSWRVDVGPPKALTRQNVLAHRDAWIVKNKKPNKREIRVTMNERGWVWPEDGLSKKHEVVKTTKGRASKGGKGGKPTRR